ncbi:SlyX family protein [Corallincola platygyrae]|uniref:Protein SlyX homolog n=1 Tax=Corallincola platygyrae TaxID=1193278 RepID=A0ABW4XM24_9GAMM
MSTPDVDSRIDELESKLAFQEDTINQLNTVIAEQDASIRLLQRQMALLAEKFKSVQGSQIASESEETPPPHY